MSSGVSCASGSAAAFSDVDDAERHDQLVEGQLRHRKAVGGEVQRRVDMSTGVLVHPKFEQVELVFGIFELLLPEELLLAEEGRKLLMKFMGEIGDAAVAGGKRRRYDSHAGGGNACRTDRGRTEQTAPRHHPLLDRFDDACIAHCRLPSCREPARNSRRRRTE